MRALLLVFIALAGCAARAPDVPLPAVEAGALRARAVAAPAIGDAQPVAVSVTSGLDAPVRLDPRQVFARDDTGARVAPLTPGEAARRSGGHAPGALKGGAVGAASGGVLGAIGGLISGAIQGGMGAAVAVGSAVGATLGAITGAVGGARDTGGHERELQDRALPATTLANGMSATGYVYYPTGRYASLELLAVDERSGGVVQTAVPVE